MTLAPSVPPPPFSQSSEELGDVTSFAPGDLEAGTRGYRRARPRYADGAYEYAGVR